MIFPHAPVSLLIIATLSIEVKAQAVSPISARNSNLILPTTPTITITINASADSARKKTFTYRNSRIAPPLFVVDGKVITSKELSEINPQNIATVSVVKGQEAITQFGTEAKNGVIIIYMKKKK